MPERLGRTAHGPALVVACVALAVAMSGGAVAAGIVANARHANRADLATRALDSDKVQGRTAVQIAAAGARAGAQLPGPASTAAGLVTVRAQQASPLPPRATATYGISCASGRILSGGFSSPAPVRSYDSYPSSETTWTLELANDDATPADVTLYATCLR
jgi:hypothetical protein